MSRGLLSLFVGSVPNGNPRHPGVVRQPRRIELIRDVGLERIAVWIDCLTALLLDRLRDEGFVAATPLDPERRGPQVAVRTHDVERAVEELARRNVVVTSRDGNVRAAFHYYNTPDDIEAYIAALKEIAPLLVRAG